jgi:hypothetical protein
MYIDVESRRKILTGAVLLQIVAERTVNIGGLIRLWRACLPAGRPESIRTMN